VTGVNDAVQDGNQPYTIVTAQATSTDPNYSIINPPDVAVTNTDNDSAGITVSPTSGLVTTEAGGQATFTIVLTSQPTGNVTIGLSSSDTGEGTVSPASVTFTAANFGSPQTVTVTGVNDLVQDGNVPYTIVTAQATSTDPNYSIIDPANVDVTNTDNDSAGFTVTPTSGLITTENPLAPNHTDTFTIVLNSQPTGNVTVGLTSSNTNEGTVSPSSLTFTPTDWNQAAAHTVTVTGVNDNPPVQDGDTLYDIITDPATSTDPNYNGKDPPDVHATNLDNDSAGFTVSPTTVTTTEAAGAGHTDTFTIVLVTQPTANVTVPISTMSSEVTVSPSSLTFTPADWNQAAAHTVTVTGVDDAVQDGDQGYTILTGPSSSTDANYAGKDPADVTGTNVDNDTADIIVSPTSLTVTEAAGVDHTGTFTIVLHSQPTADVPVSVLSSDDTQVTVSPTSFTFNSSNWQTPQTFTVTSVDDAMAEPDTTYTITISQSPPSADARYSPINPADVTVTNLDNDPALVMVTGPLVCTTTPMAGTSFNIRLSSRPPSAVMVGFHTNPATPATFSVNPVILNPSTWTGVDVAVGGFDGGTGTIVTYDIVTEPAVSSSVYNGFNPADINSCTNTTP